MVIFYDKSDNENVQNEIEKVQYKACLTITGAIYGTTREKIDEELWLHLLVERRWRSKLIFFYKNSKWFSVWLSLFVFEFYFSRRQEDNPLRSAKASKIKLISTRTKLFIKSFFPYWRAGEMNFKVEGPWNTEKYCRSPWLAGKKSFWILDALECLKQ